MWLLVCHSRESSAEEGGCGWACDGEGEGAWSCTGEEGCHYGKIEDGRKSLELAEFYQVVTLESFFVKQLFCSIASIRSLGVDGPTSLGNGPSSKRRVDPRRILRD